MNEKKIKGKIYAVDDIGTVLTISIDCRNGVWELIPIEHRMYHHILEDEHFLIGREIEYQDGLIHFIGGETGDECEQY